MSKTSRALPRTTIALATLIVALALGTSSASAASWLPHSLIFPSGVTQEKLLGVGCASSTSCTAVGQDYNGTWGAHAESGWGSGWTFQTGVTRNVGGSPVNVLNGASCTTTFCMAVGSRGNAGAPSSMAQAKSGATWSTYTTGVPAGATMSEFNSVSCKSPSWCMAVGWKMVSGTGRPWAMGFDGSSWTDTNAASLTDSVLRGVSCPTTSYCVAVGYRGSSAIAQTWTSFGGWVATPAVAVPAGGTNYILNSVSCVSATWCMAVGTYHSPSGDRPISSVWNGTAWTSKPNLVWGWSATAAAAYGVSCLSTTLCRAVGNDSSTLPVADVWDGTWWTLEPTPLAPGATNAVLRGISCVSSTRCEASGWSLFGGTPTGLIQTFS